MGWRFVFCLLVAMTGCSRDVPDSEPGPVVIPPRESLPIIQRLVVAHVVEHPEFREPGRLGPWFVGLGPAAEDPPEEWVSVFARPEEIRRRSTVLVESGEGVLEPGTRAPSMMVLVRTTRFSSPTRAHVGLEIFGGGINPALHQFEFVQRDGEWSLLRTQRPWIGR